MQMTLPVRDTISASNLFKKLDLFRLCSGLELNTSKTEARWLGSNKLRTDTPFGIRWPKDYVNALAFVFQVTRTFLTVKTYNLNCFPWKNALTCGPPET